MGHPKWEHRRRRIGAEDLLLRRSIGQLLSYMGSANSDSNRPVRGVLVANEFHPRLVMAARAVPNLSLVAYSFLFSFSER